MLPAPGPPDAGVECRSSRAWAVGSANVHLHLIQYRGDTINPYNKDARQGCKSLGRPFRSFASGARQTKMGRDGPRRQVCTGTLGNATHQHHAA
eukprot:6882761-Pyramimonas_sp.AAC.1